MRRSILALGVALAACGGDGTLGPPSTSRISVFHLISVNDSTLPRTIDRTTDLFGPINYLISSSTIQLDSAGSEFSHSYSILQVRPNSSSRSATPANATDVGLWTIADTILTLRYEDGSTAVGIVHGTTCRTLKFVSRMADGTPVTYAYREGLSPLSAALFDPCSRA